MSTKPLLDLIRKHEAPKGYDQIWSGISKRDYPPKPLTQMTIGEVLAWQDSIDAKYQSEAAGGFQILEDTLRAYYKKAGLSLSDMFDEDAQDKLAESLMHRRGLLEYVSGKITTDQFCNELAKEWASLPVVTPVERVKKSSSGKVIKRWTVKPGQSYYAGDGLNHALVTTSEVRNAVKAIGQKQSGKPVAAVGLVALIMTAVASFFEEIKAAITSLFGG